MFLPPNATPLLQPMDIGIIKPFKDKYSSSLMKKITSSLDPTLKDLGLNKVIKMIYNAWNKIGKTNIINSFGVLFGGKENILQNLPDPANHFDETDILPLRTNELNPAVVEHHMTIENNGK